MAVETLAAPSRAALEAQSFDEHGLHLSVRVPATSYDGLADRLRDLSRGAICLLPLESPSE